MAKSGTTPSPPCVVDLTQRVQVEIATDARTATVHVDPTAGENPCADTPPEVLTASVHDLLARAGVTSGIDDEAVQRLATGLACSDFDESVTVARHVAPGPGKDGTFQPAFDTGSQPGRVNSLGEANFFERGLLQKARKGEIIGSLTPPLPGKPGMLVTGKEIPGPLGNEMSLASGPGLKLVDERDFVAQMDGVISYCPGRLIDVTDLYDHHGDVDLESGNLDMEGSVAIAGAVQPQLHVTTTRDIIVGGNVEGASLRCGGNLTIMGSVFAGDFGANIQVHGDAAFRSAMKARLTVNGTLTVDRELARCRVTCGELVMTAPNSRVVGGRVRAKTRIEVQDVGAPSGTETEIRVGWDVNGRAKLMRRLRQLEIKNSGFNTRGSRGKRCRNQEIAEKIARQERKRFAEAELQLLRDARIVVRGRLHAGTVLVFGRRRVPVDDDIASATLRWDLDTQSLVITGA